MLPVTSSEGIKAVVGQIKAAVGNSDLCDFCEYVIQYVDDAMKENITKVCNFHASVTIKEGQKNRNGGISEG